MKRVRCAIYTRKSSDEGLDQTFNSLDAQREACAAYILSQACEGWAEVKERYDDGGLSGGTLERPALQCLLGDMAAGRIDIIVVYKVDRLTRSLLDFAKLVEAFDKASVSFVSITQSFNTTTSMGRLTLNMLLSFAQFEREVTAERIRDKIAASKAKGMWMGGVPPLGYRPDGRSLAVVDEHATLVRHIFDRYLELGNVRLLCDELKQQGVIVPHRTTATGRPLGGGTFSRGQLYHILSRVIYIGEIAHKDVTYPGTHQAIIERETFARVQQLLADHTAGTRTQRSTNASLLAGKLIDADGEPLVAVHTRKGKVRYRYYVSRALQHKLTDTGMRIPAREIEDLVVTRLAEAFDDPLQLMVTAQLDVPADELAQYTCRCEEVGAAIRSMDRALLESLIAKVQVRADQVEICLLSHQFAAALKVAIPGNQTHRIALEVQARLTKSGRVMRLVHGGSAGTGEIDRSLVKMLIRARFWWAELKEGEVDVSTIARREGVTRSYVSRVLRLAFLAPPVFEAVLAGRRSTKLSVASLVKVGAVDERWSIQQKQML
jgi:site-specific DNA recombinase